MNNLKHIHMLRKNRAKYAQYITELKKQYDSDRTGTSIKISNSTKEYPFEVEQSRPGYKKYINNPNPVSGIKYAEGEIKWDFGKSMKRSTRLL
jgi:hypothetical protein